MKIKPFKFKKRNLTDSSSKSTLQSFFLQSSSQWHLSESTLKYHSDWLKTWDPEILNLNTSPWINLRFDMDSIIGGS